MKRLKWMVMVAILASGTGYYWHTNKDPFADSVWVNKEANRICALLKLKQPIDSDQQNFLDAFVLHEKASGAEIWDLLIQFTTSDDQPRMLAYGRAYAKRNFPIHTNQKNAEELAAYGGKFLSVDEFKLASVFFQQAVKISEQSDLKSQRAEWAFFAGHSDERGGSTDNAIKQYSQSVQLSLDDYRPSRRLAILYGEKSKKSGRSAMYESISRKYALASLKANKDQPDLKKYVSKMSRALPKSGLQNPTHFSQSVNPIKLPGVNKPDPTPTMPLPGSKNNKFKSHP